MASLILKNPYDFYKVLTFKWHVSKFEPNRVISLQITVSVSVFAKGQGNRGSILG